MKTGEKLKIDDLREIYIKNDSCIKKVLTLYPLIVHPRYLKDIKGGVKFELESLVQTYCLDFKGILMGYEAVKILSQTGWVFEANPFIHINIEAVFYIFAPEIGDTIEAKVVQKSATHVGSLIHGIFNATSYIPAHVSREEWCGSRVKEGDTLKINITFMNFACFVPYLRGDIIEDTIPAPIKTSPNKHLHFANDDDSGISSVDKQLEDHVPKKKKKKKRKHSMEGAEGNEALEEDQSLKVEQATEDPKKETKRKKKKLKKLLLSEIKIECEED